MMKERGIEVDYATINRWVVNYSPLLEAKFRRHYKSDLSGSWRMDETYIKGDWCYLYRVADKSGDTVDFTLLKKRDKKITKPMMGFKSFACAQATLAGIELHAIFKKGQHNECSNMPVRAQFYALAA